MILRAFSILARIGCALADARDRNRRADDLEALIEATRETYPTIAREPTPLGDAALTAALAERCRIELAMAEWADEVAELADIELIELLGDSNDCD